jgi:catechol 2,3-dioxygenase-like lactoylglutathione lyase family enzyme
MFQGLHNIGLIVEDIEKTIQQYCDLLELDRAEIEIAEMKEDRLKLAFVPIADTLFEVYQPIGPAPRDARHLREMRTKGEGIFHLAFRIDDYDQEVEKLRQKGYVIEEDIVTDLDPGCRIRLAWVPPENTSGYWLELIDAATMPPPRE